LNKWWVFAAQTKVRATELGRYVLVVMLCWLGTVAVVWLALSLVTNSVFVAKLIAIPPTTVLGFLLMRRFVFR
jgi:putative flippase GtrA